MIRKLFFLSLFLLAGCDSVTDHKPQRQKAEYIYRLHDEQTFHFSLPTAESKPLYPWEIGNQAGLPKITIEFFRCKGNSLNPTKTIAKNGEVISDCAGGLSHTLPMRNGKEFVQPILLDLMNYIQKETKKKVIITAGHRCVTHHAYANTEKRHTPTKHLTGAEVSFFVQGYEGRPQEIVNILMNYYKINSKYQGKKEYVTFERWSEKTDVSLPPWYNKEIFIKVYSAHEGRDFDQRHPYPYISVQVRFDFEKQEKVIAQWP